MPCDKDSILAFIKQYNADYQKSAKEQLSNGNVFTYDGLHFHNTGRGLLLQYKNGDDEKHVLIRGCNKEDYLDVSARYYIPDGVIKH